MGAQIEILAYLERVAEENQAISLVTIYKSIPLAFDAQCIHVHAETASFKVHKYQMAITVLIKQMFIQSLSLNEFIQANVVKMDPVKLLVGLSDFRYAGNSMGRRTLVRVEPETSVPVQLQLQDAVVRAELADISIGGISIYVDPFFLESQEKGAKMLSTHCEIRFQLPAEQWREIRLRCAIRDVTRDTLSGRYRIGFQLFPDKDIEALLSRYVTRRQATTLQEIKALYERSVRGSAL